MMDGKQIVIFIGPPGSGKDTQANRLVEEYGFVQVISSKILREKFAANPEDPTIRREQKNYDEGKLISPVLISEWILEFVQPEVARGKSLVFSGSPRTPHEGGVEFPAFQKLYGPQNIMVMYLDITLDEIKRRISGRRFCKANAHPIPGAPEFAHLTACPIDGSPLERRALDNPDLIRTRMEEFQTRTLPLIDIAAKFGIPVFTLDGNRSIEAVHHDVVGILERRRVPPPRE